MGWAGHDQFGALKVEHNSVLVLLTALSLGRAVARNVFAFRAARAIR